MIYILIALLLVFFLILIIGGYYQAVELIDEIREERRTENCQIDEFAFGTNNFHHRARDKLR